MGCLQIHIHHAGISKSATPNRASPWNAPHTGTAAHLCTVSARCPLYSGTHTFRVYGGVYVETNTGSGIADSRIGKGVAVDLGLEDTVHSGYILLQFTT